MFSGGCLFVCFLVSFVAVVGDLWVPFWLSCGSLGAQNGRNMRYILGYPYKVSQQGAMLVHFGRILETFSEVLKAF